jgi:hypothetical protein
MSFLKGLFGRGKSKAARAEVPALDCPHVTLVPKWDSVQDMGVEDRATSYVCEACQQSFTPEAGRALRAAEAERLKAVAQARTEETST